MNIVSYQPWQLLQRFRRELEPQWSSAQWAPSVDVREDNDRYTVHADLPGVEAKDIQVTADDGVLTIRGDRRSEHQDTQSGRTWVERSTGSFQRSFNLPEDALAEQIKARHTNGVLEIVIPKQAQPAPRRINVEVN